MVQKAGVLHILTYKYASRHSCVPVLNIGTSKMAPTTSVFSIFTCKCASRHSRVPFFNIRTAKMAPTTSVFQHSHLQMCFAPQPRAIFQHRNFKNGSDNLSFLAFSLANVLRATAACHFSTSELQKWLREWGVLCILTCKCASRHSGVPFFTCLPEQLPPHPPL